MCPCPFPFPFPFPCHQLSTFVPSMTGCGSRPTSPGWHLCFMPAKQVELALVTGSSVVKPMSGMSSCTPKGEHCQIDESLSRVIHFQAEGNILEFNDMDLDVELEIQLQYHLSNWKRK